MKKLRVPLFLLTLVLSFAASLSQPRPAWAGASDCGYDYQCGPNGRCCCGVCIIKYAICFPDNCPPQG